ncbi:LOW QUALITY PROTEIN: trehalase [Drosophila willistoni]|uniref:LOW QUALITY PROTEIN: trehalase n=1 Tax=Drosophila willistoni TaxID=7260 RepID=UPI001F07927E|nr:LOW QUALITY PROTEIN: trehalase [Drosophila willistoni]
MAAQQCPCGCAPRPLGYGNMEIYTRGTLLDTVQRSEIYPDCKTFVDMKMRHPADTILSNFRRLRNCKRVNGHAPDLKDFVEHHFDGSGSELMIWTPSDWQAEPPYVSKIRDSELKKFALKLNDQWKQLGRQISNDVQQNPDLYSLIYVPNPFIIPGGRFREYYYWDSYWIIVGLLASGMFQTARGMIDNFLSIVRQYGFIPNGGRIYYYGRCQPPLLVQMMKAYVDKTDDEKYAIQSLPLLESEIETFLEYHKVEVEGGYIMYQYRDTSAGPRPEAYREDLASAQDFASDAEKELHYTELKAACESGMNFSSRWFVNSSDSVGALLDMKTSSIVPVDLNAILFRNCKTLSYFNKKAGNTDKEKHYQQIACRLVRAIRDVLWNEEAGIWFDYDVTNKIPRPYYSITNFYPLWMRAFPIMERKKISKSVMDYIEFNMLDDYPGGVPVTLLNTNQQWDYPNVWPCMMYVLIEGLENLGTTEAKDMSRRWADRWIMVNYEGYRKSGLMYEKYNCENSGAPGVGGEYETQTGFGWSNGVAIYYLAKYGMDLCVPPDQADNRFEKIEDEKSMANCIVTSADNMDNDQSTTNTLNEDKNLDSKKVEDEDMGQSNHEGATTTCGGKCAICGYVHSPVNNEEPTQKTKDTNEEPLNADESNENCNKENKDLAPKSNKNKVDPNTCDENHEDCKGKCNVCGLLK